MEKQMQLCGVDWASLGAVDIHDLILPSQPVEACAARKGASAEAPAWEVAFSSGADVAVRRMRGRASVVLALIPAKGLYYLWDEGTGEKTLRRPFEP